MTNSEDDLNIAELEACFLMSNEDEDTVKNIGDDEPTAEQLQIQPDSKIMDSRTDKTSFLEELAQLDENIEHAINKYSKKNEKNITVNKNEQSSLVHDGDTDSSDDEDKRNFLDRKYNDCGQQVKDLLRKQDDDKINKHLDHEFKKHVRESNSNPSNLKHELSVNKPIKMRADLKSDVYTDPIFGIRIIKPLISSTTLIERMAGKLAVSISKVKKHTECGALENDWVVAGCIVNKSPVKTSQKGTQYSIWVISDLHNDLKTISLFLFRTAHRDLWKTNQGTVVGILNPAVLDKRDGSKDEACLSVDNPQKVMIFGQSKDIGLCKSRKKNGDPCTSFVNVNKCEYCIFHIKQEYIQHSKRSELQSTFAGTGLTNLRNKILGKSEVFYAGQSYSAIPLQKNRKQSIKDKGRLSMLSNNEFSNSGYRICKQNIVNSMQAANKLNKLNAARVEISLNQREKDLERLRILKEYMPETAPKNVESRNILSNNSINIEKKSDTLQINKTKTKTFVPKLKCDNNSFIDLSAALPKVRNKAKLSALQWVKKNGPIKKIDPANLRGSESGRKRLLEDFSDDHTTKKKKTEESVMTFKSDRFKKIMEATSINEHLVIEADNVKREKYFENLEKKEAMEEKMLNTFKLDCKAVSCLRCKYTSFSASEKCKEEKHPLKVSDACKRFYKCHDCGNRTVTLDKIPKYSCKNCQSSHWIKAPMMKEKIVKNTGDILSIRGDEETFIGSNCSGGSINLLVPE